jgi:glutamyl-tRNA synthetase
MTALRAWFYARSPVRLRIDDLTTSPNPESRQTADRQRGDLAALGLDWDGPVIYQSEHTDEYRLVIERLTELELTYPCFCTRAEIRREIEAAGVAPHGEMASAYPGTCATLDRATRAKLALTREPATRLRAGATTVSVLDTRHGKLQRRVDDFVIQRSDGVAAYNLTCVVDDILASVGEVVRGDDLLDTTPRQALLYDMLGEARPVWSHVPLVLNPSGERLAKRDGAVTLSELRAAGYSATEVRTWMLRELSLPANGDLGTALAAFDPHLDPSEPWVFHPPPPRGPRHDGRSEEPGP